MRQGWEFGIPVALILVKDPVYLWIVFVTRIQDWRN